MCVVEGGQEMLTLTFIFEDEFTLVSDIVLSTTTVLASLSFVLRHGERACVRCWCWWCVV